MDSILGELSALESQLTISIEEEQCQTKCNGQSSSSNQGRTGQQYKVSSKGQQGCNEVNESLMSALEELNGVQYGVEPTSPIRKNTPLNTPLHTPLNTPLHSSHRQRPSSTGISIGRVTFQTVQDIDSAYSDDNSSLPSSGSRVSVATSASSTNSATSSGMGLSNTTSPTSEPCHSINDVSIFI